MCSIVESSMDGALAEKKVVLYPKASDPKAFVCKKCKVNKSVLNLRVRDTYCKDCFLLAMMHKFRSTLGKHKAMRPGDHVAVAFSGHPASICLAHSIRSGVDEAVKRLLFDATLLVVDESGAFHWTEEERKCFVRDLLVLAREFKFGVKITPLEDVLEPRDDNTPESIRVFDVDDDFCYEFPSKAQSERLKRVFVGIKEPSAKEDLLRNLKQRAVIRAAKQMGVKKIFTAESATSLAVTLLSGVATGRGVQLSQDTGFMDERYLGLNLQVIRPLREFSKKEIALYNSLNGLPNAVIAPTFTMLQDPGFSIEKITENFLIELQEGFPSTIPTLFRTGDKMHATQEALDELQDKACLLCGGFLDTATFRSNNALQATRFSQLVSAKGPKGLSEEQLITEALAKMEFDGDRGEEETIEDGENCSEKRTVNGCSGDGLCGEGGGGCGGGKGSAESTLTLAEIEPFLCYSCRLTASKMKIWPAFLVAEVGMKLRREKMKSDIEDFLL